MLTDLFAHVCGQNPDHTWIWGGTALPCCQRCTGLYAGVLLGLLLQINSRPFLTPRFLEIHGAFLLLMVPFGWHWIPQGAGARTVTGYLFGLGVAAFLWLRPAGKFERGPSGSSGAGRGYWVLAGLGLALLLAGVVWGGAWAAGLLAVVCLLGLGSLLGLAGWNLGQLVVGITKWVRAVGRTNPPQGDRPRQGGDLLDDGLPPRGPRP